MTSNYTITYLIKKNVLIVLCHLSGYNESDRFVLVQCSCQRLHLVQCLLQLIIILYLHRVDQKPSLTQYYTVILIPDKHSTKLEIFCTAQSQHKEGEINIVSNNPQEMFLFKSSIFFLFSTLNVKIFYLQSYMSDLQRYPFKHLNL